MEENEQSAGARRAEADSFRDAFDAGIVYFPAARACSIKGMSGFTGSFSSVRQIFPNERATPQV